MAYIHLRVLKEIANAVDRKILSQKKLETSVRHLYIQNVLQSRVIEPSDFNGKTIPKVSAPDIYRIGKEGGENLMASLRQVFTRGLVTRTMEDYSPIN